MKIELLGTINSKPMQELFLHHGINSQPADTAQRYILAGLIGNDIKDIFVISSPRIEPCK